MATKPAIHLIKDFLEQFLTLPDAVSNISMLVFSIILLFSSLYFIVRIMKSLVIKKVEVVLDNTIGKSGLLGILVGLGFTIIVQSSSITTSLLVPLIGAGILTVETVFPITMGANIGTTATAILASFATGNPAAITIAFVHFLFNCIGVLVLYPIKALRAIPINLAKGLGELAFRKRRYALLYVAGVFFLIPSALIIISRLFK
ncbi:MAG: Na/Pi symporter [Candidatus Omnitrophica bacterium]|nr:Na/Pi symporter [Candidatus Omnitrophota bacterium]